MADASEDEESEEAPETPSGGEIDEPFEASLPERAVAILVLVLMGSAMVFAVWIVVRYWNQVTV